MKSAKLARDLLTHQRVFSGQREDMNFRGLGIWMERPIIVVDADGAESEKLCALLEGDGFRTIALHSLGDLMKKIQKTTCRAVILDLDSLPVDNRFIMDLRREIPGLPIIGLSSSPFHPDLKEAMSSHICACLRKPADLDELLYCIKSFCNDNYPDSPQKERESDHVE